MIEQFEVAMLQPGLVAHVLGRRVLALGGFEAALGDAGASKQRVWAYLKQLPPLGGALLERLAPHWEHLSDLLRWLRTPVSAPSTGHR